MTQEEFKAYESRFGCVDEVNDMSKTPSTPFSNGTEFEVFKDNWCYRCRAHKERPDGFPEFPENGGCPIEDATENARFDISKFPSDMLLTLRDATTDEVICWHYCLRFNSPDEDVQFRYFDMMKRAMFKEKDGDSNVLSCRI